MNSPQLDTAQKKSCISPVRSTDQISNSNIVSPRSGRKDTQGDDIRANLKSMREASSSANAKVRKFDANVVARTAVNTLRRNQNYMVSNLRKGAAAAALTRRRA